jgi:uncharacterized protein
MIGAAARVTGFMTHLRRNGFAVGPGETELVLSVLAAGTAFDEGPARLAMKTMLAGGRGQWERFDELFDAYWHGRGVKMATRAAGTPGAAARRPEIWDKILPADDTAQPLGLAGRGAVHDDAEAAPEGAGRLVGSRNPALATTDLRRLVTPEETAEAAEVAEHLARAMRYRLSRRRVPSRRGATVDLRRTIRRNLSRGGEPVELLRRRRPDRPVKIVVLLDVSGSMKLYSRYFLNFLRGLLGSWLHADAYLFHTRLVRITDALREKDRLKAMDRLSLMVEGFGGGTRIAGALKSFNDRFAREAIDSRSVIIVMSDGYDTDPPEELARELARLKRRARRLVWLNPLLGWRDYAPVARAMGAAMPYIDCFAAAHSLASLAALETEFARL